MGGDEVRYARGKAALFGGQSQTFGWFGNQRDLSLFGKMTSESGIAAQIGCKHGYTPFRPGLHTGVAKKDASVVA